MDFTKDQIFLLNANEISCKSMLFGRSFPMISNLTRVLPYFIQYEHCDGTCNPGINIIYQMKLNFYIYACHKIPDAEGIYSGWKTTKKGYKFRKTFVLAEGSHLSIVCPEY